jgi:hypothetical protein
MGQKSAGENAHDIEKVSFDKKYASGECREEGSTGHAYAG